MPVCKKQEILQKLIELKQECERQYPGVPQRLIMSRMQQLEWRKLNSKDWISAGWKVSDEDLTSIDRSDDVFIAALKRRLHGVNIIDVIVEGDGSDMRTAPADSKQ